MHTEQGAHEYIIFKESLLSTHYLILYKRLPEGIFEPYYQLEWLYWLESCLVGSGIEPSFKGFLMSERTRCILAKLLKRYLSNRSFSRGTLIPRALPLYSISKHIWVLYYRNIYAHWLALRIQNIYIALFCWKILEQCTLLYPGTDSFGIIVYNHLIRIQLTH